MDNKTKKKPEWILNTLPEPWIDEFVQEVLVSDEYTQREVDKTFTYYLMDCWDVLPIEVKDKVEEKYIIIEL